MAIRRYTIPFPATAIANTLAPFDIFEIVAGANTRLQIVEFQYLFDVDTIPAAFEDLGRYEIYRGAGSYTSGSGGTTLATSDFKKNNPGDNNAGATGERLNTTVAAVGAGSLTLLRQASGNVFNGWIFHGLGLEYYFDAGEAIIIRQIKNMTNERTHRGQLVIDEEDV